MRNYPHFVTRKLNDLGQLADELSAAASAMTSRIESLRLTIGQVKSDVALKKKMAQGSNADFDAATIDKEVAAMQAEIDQLVGLRTQRRAVADEAIQVVAQVRDYLNRLPDTAELVEADEAELPTEGNLLDHLADTRRTIVQVLDEQKKVLHSVLPDDNRKAEIEKFVKARALKPRVGVGTGVVRADFTHGQFANPSEKPTDAFGIACWLIPAIVAKELYKASVERRSSDVLVLTGEERTAQLAELADWLLELEPVEERIVAECLSRGQAVQRRERANPLAILGANLNPQAAAQARHAVAA